MISQLKPILTAPAVLLCLCAVSVKQAHASSDELSIFAAVNLSVGYKEQGSLGEDFSREQSLDRFISINPELQVSYKGFFLELPGNVTETEDGQYAGPAVGYSFWNTENWVWDIYYAVTSGSSNYTFTSPELRYSIKNEADVRLGLRTTGYFNNLMTQVMIMPQGKLGGFEASASARYDWQYGNINFFISGGARYRSSEIWNHYFGLSEDQNAIIGEVYSGDDIAQLRETFFPYQADGGVSVSLQAGFQYPLAEHWVIGGFVNAERFPGTVSDSPFRDGDDVNIVTALNLTYVF